MREIYPNIYHVPIPLANSPLKELNCYIIKSDARNLIIDTGFNQPYGKAILLSAIESLNIPLEQTDIFISHLHADHSGLVCSLKNDHNKAYTSHTDGVLTNGLQSEWYWNNFDERNQFMGFPQEQLLDRTKHPAYMYRPDHEVDFTEVSENDIINVGDYKFSVVDMAGHTPGQIGLYEPTHKICFCADHILAKISPNIISWDLENDYIGIFLQNLQKVQEMDIKHLFGGHRVFVEDHKVRIDELLNHHSARLQEVLLSLAERPLTPYEVAHHISWDFSGGVFNDFPVQQKWFAVSETLAHLQHLYFTNKINRTLDNGVLVYSAIA